MRARQIKKLINYIYTTNPTQIKIQTQSISEMISIVVSIVTSVFMTCYMLISMCVKMQILVNFTYFSSSMLEGQMHIGFGKCVLIMIILQGMWICNHPDLFLMDVTILLEKIKGLQ